MMRDERARCQPDCILLREGRLIDGVAHGILKRGEEHPAFDENDAAFLFGVKREVDFGFGPAPVVQREHAHRKRCSSSNC